MEWPLKDPTHPNKFVTTPTNQEIWLRVAAVAIAQQQQQQQQPPSDWHARLQQWQDKVQQCSSSKWRFAYRELIGELIQIMSEIPSPQLFMEMCEAGLQAAQELFVMRVTSSSSDDPSTTTTTVSAKEVFFNDAIAAQISNPLNTVTFHGSNAETLENNNAWSTTNLSQSKLDGWATYGCMEASAAQHAASILVASNENNNNSNPSIIMNNLTEFAANKLFVMLGATSEMGPTPWLFDIPGAHVLAIARPGSKLRRLVEHFQASAHTSTTLQVPSTATSTSSSDAEAGVDMLTHGPHIARWIIDVAAERSKTSGTKIDIVLCSLAYLDGEAHVRVSVAMDLIVDYVRQHWTGDATLPGGAGGGKVVLWYLTSPTTVLAIPPQAAQAAQERYQQRPTWQRIVHTVSLGTWLQPTLVWKQPQAPTEDSTSSDIESSHQNHSSLLQILNNLVTIQGPNYGLAKTMQEWRCMVEDWRGRNDKSVVVVAPCGPPTRTQNMVSHPQIAATLDGLDYLPPLMAFSVQDASVLMTAILISMTRAKSDPALSSSPPSSHRHPMTIFWEGSVHGGYWQCPFQSDSSGVLTYVLGSTVGKWKTSK